MAFEPPDLEAKLRGRCGLCAGGRSVAGSAGGAGRGCQISGGDRSETGHVWAERGCVVLSAKQKHLPGRGVPACACAVVWIL